MTDTCKICNGHLTPLLEAKVLNKYDVKYFKCNNCGFIQTENPYWLNESYSSAITFLDIGLVSRNLHLSKMIKFIVETSFNPKGKFLDYAGGYGLMVRLMRDNGYNFYRHDIYCENLFAKTFDVTDEFLTDECPYELVTAFEVFEHLANPIEEIEKMLKYSTSILFSTLLQPKSPITNSNDWWYLVPETGQHIAFYTEKSLNLIANHFGLKYYKINDSLHLFTKKNGLNIRKIISVCNNSKLAFLYEKLILKRRKSLLLDDYNLIIGRKIL